MNLAGLSDLGMDYSGLFGSLGSAASQVAGSSFLSDWYSIKNGSTYKLYRAHYNELAKTDSADKTTDKSSDNTKETSNKDSDKTTTSKTSSATTANSATSKDSAETLTKVKSAATDLKAATDAFTKTGTKSLFQDTESMSAKDRVYGALSTFVDSYNAMIKSQQGLQSNSISNGITRMTGSTKANATVLGKMGITIGEDNMLSLDKEAFEKADLETVKDLFVGYGSFGSQTSTRSLAVLQATEREAARAATYKESGTYSPNNTEGSVFDGFF
ncbi:MAG: hypothetical protein LBM60_07955 [Clostridium sp.]|jgi:hypothetical protein|nr:hypothetical protein [Clostridium sp.]